jgi:hypothetical protein
MQMFQSYFAGAKPDETATRCWLLSISEDIFYLFQYFLSNKDYKSFLNSSKQFTKIKINTLQYRLNSKDAISFCDDQSFREIVLSRLKDKSRQLSVDISYFPKETGVFQNLNYLSGCKSVRLNIWEPPTSVFATLCNIQNLHLYGMSQFTSFPYLKNVKKLTLVSFFELTDVSQLFDVSEITLIHCKALTDISGLSKAVSIHLQDCERLTDISSLGTHQKKISIINCPVVEVNQLSKVSFLSFTDCKAINNIEELGNVAHLELINCPNIFNINQLTHNSFVAIDRCNQIISFDSLADIPSVSLKNVWIKTLNPFQYIQELKLSNCNHVKDLSPLMLVKRLTLEKCDGIFALTANLKDLDYLEIFGCENLRGIALIGNDAEKEQEMKKKRHVVLSCCFGIVEFSSLRNIFRVDIICFSNPLDATQLTNIAHLTLRLCGNICNLDALKDTRQTLILSQCNLLNSIPNGFENIPTVKMIDCPLLTNLDGLQNNKFVYLENCPNVATVKKLKTVKMVQIVNCPQSTDWNQLKNVVMSDNSPPVDNSIDWRFLNPFNSFQNPFYRLL